ncbi:hypothetical protein, partial [Victivallis vadensis]|uniref:hypothetical protein n=1 Tax=Victivallis vadensis TaxID=172901 RepID=UPI00266DD1DB
APCRSGSKGEAPWSPKAKFPFEELAYGVYSEFFFKKDLLFSTFFVIIIIQVLNTGDEYA